MSPGLTRLLLFFIFISVLALDGKSGQMLDSVWPQ